MKLFNTLGNFVFFWVLVTFSLYFHSLSRLSAMGWSSSLTLVHGCSESGSGCFNLLFLCKLGCVLWASVWCGVLLVWTGGWRVSRSRKGIRLGMIKIGMFIWRRWKNMDQPFLGCFLKYLCHLYIWTTLNLHNTLSTPVPALNWPASVPLAIGHPVVSVIVAMCIIIVYTVCTL